MASKPFDFSQLTPDERIELAEQLWDSLPIEAVGPDADQLAELRGVAPSWIAIFHGPTPIACTS
jgi:hypothetical protein